MKTSEKKGKNQILLDGTADQRLGTLLSEGLGTMPTGPCLTDGEISTLVEGTVNRAEQDRMHRHLASCATCRQIFLLTSDLEKLEDHDNHGSHGAKKTFTLYRWHALAAVIVVLVFSLYLFYRYNSLPLPGAAAPAMQSPASPKAEKSLGPISMEAESRRMALEGQRKKETTDARQDSIGKMKGKMKAVAEKKGKGIAGSYPGEQATAPVGKKFEEQRPLKKRQRSLAVLEDRAMPAAPSRAVPPNPAWERANSLNQRIQSLRGHIPGAPLHAMFAEALQLSRQLRSPFETLRKEAATTGDIARRDTFMGGVIPLVTIISGPTGSTVIPNIGYFLSRSIPGSPGHRFFNLARFGWCDTDGQCHNFSHHNRTAPRSAELLEKWRTLSPLLTGTYREIAHQTITHLESQNGES